MTTNSETISGATSAVNRRILIIDDSRAIHDDFRKVLQNRHPLEVAEARLFGKAEGVSFELDCALQGQDGLTLVRRALAEGRPFATAFVDMRMPPGWDGLETIKRIWEVAPELQVVICSAYSDYSWAEIRDALAHLDRLLILNKPFDATEVIQLAHGLTEKWRLHQIAKGEMSALEKAVAERTRDLMASRIAALNMMQDAVESQQETESANQDLRREIAERLRAEEALRESEERFRQLAENIEEVFWMTDLERKQMLYVSPNYEQIWGRTCESLYALPRSWMDSVHPEDRERISKAVANQQGSGAYNEEYRVVRPDHSTRWIHDKAFPVRNLQGQVYRIVGVAEDITERKKLEAQFLRAQRLESIGTLASGVAHDLNNILAPIMMASQVLRLKNADRETERLMELIDTNIQRGAHVVKQILTFARGMEGKRAEVQLRHVIKDMVKIIQETFPKAITLRTRVPADLWTVIGDSTQLHQVLLNMCVNARDAMPEGGCLSLHASNLEINDAFARQTPEAAPGPYIVLEVADSGTGIPPAILEKIFDPFFTTKPQGKGTGLGLSTVLGIVKGHGGFVQVHSEEGRGATFKVFLPAKPEAAERPTANAKTHWPGGRGELVLVVDDEEPIRRMAQEILTQSGYEVVSAANGSEGLVTFIQRQGTIKAVITDMMMPVMDGLALTKALKQLQPGIPIIASSGLSSGANEGDKRAALSSLGVTTLLAKPYSAEKLLVALNHFLHPSAGHSDA